MARKAFALAALFGCLSLAIGLTDYPDPAKGGMILLGAVSYTHLTLPTKLEV